MARPPATIIMSHEVDDFFGIDILAATKLYAVVYKLEPINIKTRYWNVSGEIKKYLRTTYPNKKPAENLAKKLNEYFNCEDFTVKQI